MKIITSQKKKNGFSSDPIFTKKIYPNIRKNTKNTFLIKKDLFSNQNNVT